MFMSDEDLKVKHTWKALLAKPRPSCLQTTMASIVPQPSLHTVPHTREPLRSIRTSTRPSKGLWPPLNRSWNNEEQTGHVILTMTVKMHFGSQSIWVSSYPLLEAHGRNIAPHACVLLMTAAFRVFIHIEGALSDRLLKARTLNLIHMYRAHS